TDTHFIRFPPSDKPRRTLAAASLVRYRSHYVPPLSFPFPVPPMTPPTRRTFLGTSLAAVSTAGLHPRLAVAGANEKIVVGVMGTGGRGTSLAQSFAKQPNVEVAYVCDVDPGRAGKAKEAVEKGSKSQ